MFCAEWCLVKHQNPQIEVIPLRCKCWHCDECRPMRAAGVVRDANAGKPNLFVTLTSRRRPGRSPDAAARALARAWRQVRAEYLKIHGKHSLPFLAVFEATKKGWPHIHIVARCKWLDQKKLSKRMGQLIGAPVVGVERIKHKSHIAYYVTKYIGKNPHRFTGVKRYWRSLDYFFPVEPVRPEDDDPWDYWDIVRFTWRTEVARLERQGYTAVYSRNGAVLTKARPP